MKMSERLQPAIEILDDIDPILSQDLRWIGYATCEQPTECRNLCAMVYRTCEGRAAIHPEGNALRERWTQAAEKIFLAASGSKGPTSKLVRDAVTVRKGSIRANDILDKLDPKS